MYQEDELRKGELEKDTDRMMREYRAQLDAERARKLANGRNHSSSKSDRKKGQSVDVQVRIQILAYAFISIISFTEDQYDSLQIRRIKIIKI